jgi:natural product precursor
MRPAKKLTLKKELLSELSSEQLTEIVGGTHANCLTLPNAFMCLSLRVCNVTHQLECNAPSILPDTCLC